MGRAQSIINEIVWHHSIYSKKKPLEISELISRFINLPSLESGTAVEHFNTVRQVHRLAWSLDKPPDHHTSFSPLPHLDIALAIIDSCYHPGMLLGLFDTLLKHWMTLELADRQKLSNFIAGKVKDYSGKRICITNIKQHMRYYSCRDGSVALSETLFNMRLGLSSIWQYLQLPDHVKGYEYFSEGAISYTNLVLQQAECEKYLLDIIKFLNIHQRVDVSKKCLTMMILAMNRFRNSQSMEEIQTAALELIGNPSDRFSWQIWKGATGKELSDFQGARKRIKELIIEWLIRYFFQRIVDDEAKKKLWLKYAPHVSNVKIHCSENIYGRLNNNHYIRPYLQSYFHQIRGPRTDQTLLVLTVEDYLLIESVADTNAFYACRKENPLFSHMNRDPLKPADLKKLQEMKPLVERRGENVIKHKPEGKVLEGEVRASLLAWWMRHYLSI